MSRPIIKTINVITGEEIKREMNDAEFVIWQADQAATAARKAEETAKVATRQALLNKLGITEEEARLLLGGN